MTNTTWMKKRGPGPDFDHGIARGHLGGRVSDESFGFRSKQRQTHPYDSTAISSSTTISSGTPHCLLLGSVPTMSRTARRLKWSGMGAQRGKEDQWGWIPPSPQPPTARLSSAYPFDAGHVEGGERVLRANAVRTPFFRLSSAELLLLLCPTRSAVVAAPITSGGGYRFAE